MPSDIEIHLGAVGPEAVDKLVNALGLQLTDDDGNNLSAVDLRNDPDLWLELDDTPLLGAIKAAYEAVVSRMGWTITSHDADGYYQLDTPYGPRKTSGFGLSLQYDQDEIGDEPDDLSLGINLSSRYYPAVIDMKNAHGTLNGAFYLEDHAKAIQICKEELLKQLPALDGTKTFIRNIFY